MAYLANFTSNDIKPPLKPQQKSMRKLKLDDMIQIEPLTDNQKEVFYAYSRGDSLVLSGSAGTGKTFIAMSLALEDVLDKETEYDKVIVIRSIVPKEILVSYLAQKKKRKMLILDLINLYVPNCLNRVKHGKNYKVLVLLTFSQLRLFVVSHLITQSSL